MKGHWNIWLLVTGLAYVSGNICDGDSARACLGDLAHYETRAFPLYGQDEANLEVTCGNINTSLECIHTYVDTCGESPECDELCHEFVLYIPTFIHTTRISNFAEEMCDEENINRKTYLENYQCLENNLELYTSCHHDSEQSLKHIITLSPSDYFTAVCCYFSWYYDCFLNITRDQCGENATAYVEFGLDVLVSARRICASYDISCAKPPLPSDVEGHEKPDKKATEEKTINNIEDVDDINSGTHETSAASILSIPYPEV